MFMVIVLKSGVRFCSYAKRNMHTLSVSKSLFSFCLLSSIAAVDRQLRPRYVTGFIRCQEQNAIGDSYLLALPLYRVTRYEVLDVVRAFSADRGSSQGHRRAS